MRAAVNKLPQLDNVGYLTDELSTILIGMEFPPIKKMADLRKTGEAGTEREIKSLILHTSKLKRVLTDLHSQTKSKLWDTPSFKNKDGQQVRADVTRLLDSLFADLETLATVAKLAKATSETKKHSGRTKNLKNAGVTRVVSSYYKRITGLNPNRSRSPHAFIAFLSAIFNALGISSNAERAAREVIEEARTKC